jgi:Protein of unknown function (DUF982)
VGGAKAHRLHVGAVVQKVVRQRCFGALNGKASAADARSAFIEAAKEADIFIDYMKKGK